MWPSGAAVSIPGFDGDTVRALAATGDGRVFLMRHPANGPVLWIDRDDRTHTLLDASGTAPFTFPAEHLLFDPAGNALIASTSGGWTPQPACATNVCSFFRTPLSADGKRVGGPVTCNSYATSSQEVMSLDLLPNGFVLATVASGAPFSDPKLITVDPLTLAIQPFASPGPGDLDGGYWSDALGAAVVLDDAANVLRAYAPGAGGLGTVISTSVAVSDFTSGYSPVEGMWQVDVAGPGCPGWADLYGAPLFGSAGFSPWLTLRGCPALGEKLGLVLSRALGGAPGLIAVGLAPAATPFLGGTLLVDPSATLIPVQTLGTAGVAGAGGFDLPVKITAPVLVGVPLYLQVFVADPGAPQGVSLTNGLELVLG